MKKINKSLQEVKDYLGVVSEGNWTQVYYQYCNRLAHLYFLRKNGVNAYLVFVYFIGDRSVKGPETKEKWLEAIQNMEKQLGILGNNKLSPYITNVFIPVEKILISTTGSY